MDGKKDLLRFKNAHVLKIMVIAVVAACVSAFSVPSSISNQYTARPRIAVQNHRSRNSGKDSRQGALWASVAATDAGDADENKVKVEITSSDVDSDEKLDGNMFTYKNLFFFWLSICGNWFVEPLQSLIDTIVVGRVSTMELAALGPASMGFDSLLYICYFLAIATTNQLGTAIANKDEEEQQRITSNNLGVGLFVGLGVMALIYGGGTQIMQFLVGAENANLIPSALAYTRIRVVTVLASLFLMVTQAASFCWLDTTSPVIAVAVATLINSIGDYMLCLVGGFGIRGAALATALGQLVAAIIMFVRLKGPLTAEGKKPMISLPKPQDLFNLVKLAGPILFLIVGELFCHLIMTKRVTTFGVLDLATHAVLLRLYIFFGIFGESLSQTVQALFPRLLPNRSKNADAEEEETKKSLNKIFRKRIWNLSFPIGILGCVLAFVNTFYNGSLFASDSLVLSKLKVAAPFMASVLMLNPFNYVSDGLAMTQKQFKRIILSYVTSISALYVAMPFCTNLSHVWTSFFGFQVFRYVQRTIVSKILDFRNNKKPAAATA